MKRMIGRRTARQGNGLTRAALAGASLWILAGAVPGTARAADATGADDTPLDEIVVTAHKLGIGETRANSIVDAEAIKELPPGLDPLKMINRVPGVLVGSSDAMTGSFSMRLSMRGLNKEQIGVSVDGIPNGSTLSNGGTMPSRLIDGGNLERISVSQSAGEIGTPSNQALGGYIDFQSRDPAATAGGAAELSGGDVGYRRAFARLDTGEIAHGLTAYVSYSHEQLNTWPGAQSGESKRDHVDFKMVKEFDNGAKVKASFSYNDLSDNDYDAVALRAVSAPFYKANFETNPNTDGLTDAWTGDPNIDQNNRKTRGIDSREYFSHIDVSTPLTDSISFSVKPYYHHEEGAGWFYVPYVQLPANGQLYSAVAPGGKATGTVQECYANQYAHTASGALIPVAAVTYPGGTSAAALKAAGCPAAAKYQMNPTSQWGAREASRRKGGYEMDREGGLSELKGTIGDNQELRAGIWVEHIDRAKTRNWYKVTDPKIGDDYSDSGLYSITQDRHYASDTHMYYGQYKLRFLDSKAEVSAGLTYQDFDETYRSPVEFAGTRELSVHSDVLPKVGLLYHLTDSLELFASGSRNFSALPDSVFEGTAAIDSKKGIQPETSTNYDVGARWALGNFGFSVQGYWIDYDNRISIQNGNPDGDIFSRDATTTFLNQGGITSRGVELTATAQFGSVDLYGNYAFNDAFYKVATPAEGISKGDPVLGQPRHSLYGEVGWRPIDPLRLMVNARYVGRQAGTYGAVQNTVVAGGPAYYPREYMPVYTLVGLSATYRLDDNWVGPLHDTEIAVNVDNLFDQYYLAGIGMELTTSNPLTSGRYFLGSPRTFVVTLRTKY
ncbi:TonB-dependent receptor [Nitrospirillum amazonense]|uniref:TonB-dependent receptor n=1 Tax=Nitrospirillum amazonense TaxID=28077 RepID=UPI002DD41CBD|nr:TonB-dependent receptor [Nitrospirillum amazonense]MEC4593820.1 TonB-dependent receptor [Nitrospirillum amazonense]